MSQAEVAPVTADDAAPPTRRSLTPRWQALIGIAALVGLVVAARVTSDRADGVELPSAVVLAGAYVLQAVSLACGAQAWIALFPGSADRAALARGLYVSQLTKYLPVGGGMVQQASQVALARQEGLGNAALRLPVFSLCAAAASATCAAPLAFDDSLPAWGRALAAAGVFAPILIDSRILRLVLGLARRVVKRLPEPDKLPAQREVFRCYAWMVANLVAYSGAFVLIIGDLAHVNWLMTASALCVSWVLGYIAFFVPSGLIVREAVLVAVLTVPTNLILSASVAHRLLALAAEATMAAASHLRRALKRS